MSLEMGRVRESIWRRRGERGQRYRNKGPTVVSAIAEGCDRVLFLNNSWPTEDAAYRGYRRATGRLGCTFCFAPSSHASRRGISFRTDDNVHQRQAELVLVRSHVHAHSFCCCSLPCIIICAHSPSESPQTRQLISVTAGLC